MDPVTIPKLDPSVSSDLPLSPELTLLVAVVAQALSDLQKPQHRAEALAFIHSSNFELICEWLEWDVNKVRKASEFCT